MEHFSKEASYFFLHMVELSWEFNHISKIEFEERLLVLYELSDTEFKEEMVNTYKMGNMLSPRMVDLIETKIYIDEEWDEADSYKAARQNTTKGDGITTEKHDDNDPVLHFISKASGKISKWDFHKTDSDPLPSIPHGHSIENHTIKLDAYLGYITKDNRLIGREKRKYIIDLWNDEEFRAHALETITYYYKTYKHYTWRVPNPFKLPKRR
jgi:hypothetical protein